MTHGVQDDRLPHLAACIGADYADSFAACREMLASMFELEAPSAQVRADFFIDFALYDYGPIKLGTSRGSPAIMVRGPQTIARTGVDQFHVQYYRTGGFTLTLDGADKEVRPGDICMLDLSRPAALRIDGIDNLSAIVSRELLLPLLADASDVHGLILRRDSEAGVAVREHLEEMWRQGSELTLAQGLERSRATAALLAGVIRANSQSRAATRVELRKSQFRAICRRIDQALGDPGLGPATLTSQFFVTRPTLYRMFEAYGGIGKYILGRRLTGVFRDLSDPALARERVATLLRRWGFESHTAAGRAFRAAYGMTPLQCRARSRDLHRAGAVAGEDAFDIPPEMPARIMAFQHAPGSNA